MRMRGGGAVGTGRASIGAEGATADAVAATGEDCARLRFVLLCGVFVRRRELVLDG